ncbi:hypothetical protein [Rhodovulum steppense]|uniref:Uncharacterized protein n=1 Tax=Rhodovulum steppense TaxID=540251 RepID=A0A4R1Z178_9RHOB|nr:hypothetical protein [Rhodovulum steppense]TCM87106.1 hypothetical protein EV216_103184 [Rhodovulum steppense]
MRTKDTLFRSTSQETKADTTARVAREIIQSEAEERQKKTAAQRAARLEREAVDRGLAEPRKSSAAAPKP